MLKRGYFNSDHEGHDELDEPRFALPERAGMPRSVAMPIVGHKTESIYRHYAIVDEGMQREPHRRDRSRRHCARSQA